MFVLGVFETFSEDHDLDVQGVEFLACLGINKTLLNVQNFWIMKAQPDGSLLG